MVCVCHSTGTDRLEATKCDPTSCQVPGQLHSAADGHFRAENGIMGWFQAQLFRFSLALAGGREVNESPTTQVNTLYTLEFPTKLLTIAILCLCFVCVETGKKCGWQGSGAALCLKP